MAGQFSPIVPVEDHDYVRLLDIRGFNNGRAVGGEVNVKGLSRLDRRVR